MTDEPQTFEPGDVVHMGRGPHMTVEHIDYGGVGVIGCAWFDTRNRLHRDIFDATNLKHVVGMP